MGRGSFTLNNLTLVNNSVRSRDVSRGGGLSVTLFSESDATLTNLLVVGNSANRSDAAGIYVAPGDSLTTLRSSLIAANINAGGAADIGGGSFDPASSGNIIGYPDGITSIGQIVAVDSDGKPLLADNGGPTRTVALAAGSPASAAGLALDDLTTDQRGLPRHNPPDIGAFEAQNPTPTVVIKQAGGRHTGQPLAASASVAAPNRSPGDSLDGVGLTFAYFDAQGNPLSDPPTLVGSYSVTVVYPGSANFRAARATRAFSIVEAANASISGRVYADFNLDGLVNFGEQGIAGATILLSGFDDLGQKVERQTKTDAQGVYLFRDLRASNSAGYTITELQPAGFLDGKETAGLIDGKPIGDASVNDRFSGIVLHSGESAMSFNFGERTVAAATKMKGQSASIGFWNNKGQKLLTALNGGPSATQLGAWLAATFPNLYGALAGKTNVQVAVYYKALFALKVPAGSPKLEAEVMATALSIYVTNQTLAAHTAKAYGFKVSPYGLGGDPNVMDVLVAVDARSKKGLVLDSDGNARIDAMEATNRKLMKKLFGSINQAGGI